MKSNAVIISLALLLFLCSAHLNAQNKRFNLLPASASGLHFTNAIKETEDLNVLSYEYFFNGAGTAVGDINNDGLPDLFLTANMGPNKLFLNLGNLKFKDITEQASTLLKGRTGGWKTGVAMADVNGDGWLDIYVCYSGNVADDLRRNQLFINNQKGGFTEEARQFGLDDKSYSTQAAFFDFDNDGDLDLFLLNHSNKKTDNLELARYRNDVDELAGSKLYRNDNNKFVDVSATAGIRQNPLTYGLGIAIADINQDGWQDVYVTNDYNEPDYCYLNQKNGTFKDVAKDAFRHLAQFSMGTDIADLNNDGLPDIVNLDMLPEDNKRQKLLQLQENYESFQLMINQQLNKQYMHNMLQLNNGDGTFSEIAQLAGISNTDWSWCPLMADFDNDGLKDLFITNGYLRDYTNKDFLRYWGDYKVRKAIDREPAKLMDLVQAMPSTSLFNYMFQNKGNLSFANKKEDWGFTQAGISSSAIYADLDRDGDLDLVVNRINQDAALYENTSGNNTNFLDISLRYSERNRFGTGTKLYVYTKGNTQYFEVNPTRGYLSSLPYNQHIGLGTNTRADSVIIIWPNQRRQKLVALPSGFHTIEYVNPEPPAPSAAPIKPLFTAAPNWGDFKHEAPEINDFKRQLLMTFMYSQTGPFIRKADLDHNGLEDLVVGGNPNQGPEIYLQQANGQFTKSQVQLPASDYDRFIGDIALADLNGDGAVDLYLAMGGYAYLEPGDSSLQDQLYLNDGKGNFSFAPNRLPVLNQSAKSCVRPYDIDGDGDLDLFVGGRVIPGQYPVNPESYLLINDGKGNFTKADVPFAKIGMVTDACWTDLFKDGKKELVLVGEFMGVRAFQYANGSWQDKSAECFGTELNGLWFSVASRDLDGDGWEDLVVGNIGTNTQLKCSVKEPMELYYSDFDQNGSIDPFLNFYIQGISYPFVSRDELNDQIYGMRKRFSSYKDYSTATMQQIFTKEELAKAEKKTATENRSVVLLNRKGHFELQPLPVQAQFSVITQIIAEDFNRDGKPDLLLLGNKADNRLKIGGIEANYGCLLIGDGHGQFSYMPQYQSGLSVKGDCKSALIYTYGGQQYLFIGISNAPILQFKY